MKWLLTASRTIDRCNFWLSRCVMWLVLASVLISAGNAVVRKAFNVSSNAYLEIQWYLFSAVFLLAAGYTLLVNEHVRIDVIAQRLSRRVQSIIDIIGIIVFVLPLCYFVVQLSWPFFMRAYVSGEMSFNAGGLVRWPVYILIPIGFSLLGLQALSELVKRVAFLRGLRDEHVDNEFIVSGQKPPIQEQALHQTS